MEIAIYFLMIVLIFLSYDCFSLTWQVRKLLKELKNNAVQDNNQDV